LLNPSSPDVAELSPVHETALVTHGAQR
jgi:hypothetical protein